MPCPGEEVGALGCAQIEQGLRDTQRVTLQELGGVALLRPRAVETPDLPPRDASQRREGEYQQDPIDPTRHHLHSTFPAHLSRKWRDSRVL